MANGKGCTCNAQGEHECACDADWTPQELIDARAAIATLKKDARLCAEYIKPLWHEKHNTPNPLKEAVYRILEATKEADNEK